MGVVNEVESTIERIVELLGPTARQAWEIALRQVVVQRVWSIVGLCIWLSVIVGCLWILRSLSRHADALVASGNYCSTDVDNAGALSYGVFVPAGFAVLMFLTCLKDLIGYSINPSYYAIQMLLGAVR